MATRHGGSGRVSAKNRQSEELRLLGEILASAREANGVKQSEAAQKLGMPASYLSKIEKGNRRVDVVEVIRISEAIGEEPSAIVARLQAALRERGEVDDSSPVQASSSRRGRDLP